MCLHVCTPLYAPMCGISTLNYVDLMPGVDVQEIRLIKHDLNQQALAFSCVIGLCHSLPIQITIYGSEYGPSQDPLKFDLGWMRNNAIMVCDSNPEYGYRLFSVYLGIHRKPKLIPSSSFFSLTYITTPPITTTNTSKILSALYSKPVKGFRPSSNKYTSEISRKANTNSKQWRKLTFPSAPWGSL